MKHIQTILITVLIGFDVYDKNTQSFADRFQRIVELPFSENDRMTYEELLNEDTSNTFIDGMIKEAVSRTIDKYLSQVASEFEKSNPDQKLTNSVLTDPQVQVVEQTS